MIGMFHGKPVEDMDREELLKVIEYLAAENQRHTSPDRIRAYALGSVEMLKRGERRAS